MTAPPNIDPARFLSEQLEQAIPDLTRSMTTTFINALMSAEARATGFVLIMVGAILTGRAEEK